MSDRLAVATRKGLFVFERGPQGWSLTGNALLGEPVTMVLPDADGTLLAAVGHGHFGPKLKRSTDGGRSWEERPTPTYPPKPEDEEDIDPIRRTPLPWSLDTIWCMEHGPAARPEEIWCGTIPGGLFRSTDRGTSWELIDSLWRHPDRKLWSGGGADFAGIHSILIHSDAPDTMQIGVSVGGLWGSVDGGESWACRGEGMRAAYLPPEQAFDPKLQDPHRVVQCAASPEHLWIQHHNGIFRSTDGGQSCHEIEAEPSSFGFAVAVHPQDPDTAWFVPGVRDDARYPVDGALLVNRTRDGGKTFEQLREGLPQQHAYDLAYRHALDIDDSGDRLAFGSTTGNLWLSEDQGDRWQTLSNFLPPVYCVRFG